MSEVMTVEAALVELHEMFPRSWFQLTVNANYDRNSYQLRMPDFKDTKEFVGPTLEHIVNAVRAWANEQGDNRAVKGAGE